MESLCPLLEEKIGASEGIRTLDVHLGKVMLYQTELRSLPKLPRKLRELGRIASPVFAMATGREPSHPSPQPLSPLGERGGSFWVTLPKVARSSQPSGFGPQSL